MLPSQFIQVYLPALEGHVPDDVIRTFCAFFEFCYIVRRNVITDGILVELQDALSRFHQHREVFRDIGVRPDGFALPRQHSLTHYESLIRLFGAPNGLCTSITESRHITAVKKPWRRSNKHNALGQILQTNQRLSQLAAARADFEARGMLPVSHPSRSRPQGQFMILWHLHFRSNTTIAFPNSQADPPSLARHEGGNDGNPVPPEDREDQSIDEDLSAGVVDERPGLAHSDVKLAHKPGEYIADHFTSQSPLTGFCKHITVQKMH